MLLFNIFLKFLKDTIQIQLEAINSDISTNRNSYQALYQLKLLTVSETVNQDHDNLLLYEHRLCIQFVNNLISCGIDVNITDQDGTTLLHIVFMNWSQDDQISSKIADILLKHGANPNSKNKERWCPLHLSIKKQKIEAVKYAILYNSFILQDNQQKNSKQLRKILFSFNKSGGPKGFTPIHVVISNCDSQLYALFYDLIFIKRNSRINILKPSQNNLSVFQISIPNLVYRKCSRKMYYQELRRKVFFNFEKRKTFPNSRTIKQNIIKAPLGDQQVDEENNRLKITSLFALDNKLSPYRIVRNSKTEREQSLPLKISCEISEITSALEYDRKLIIQKIKNKNSAQEQIEFMLQYILLKNKYVNSNLYYSSEHAPIYLQAIRQIIIKDQSIKHLNSVLNQKTLSLSIEISDLSHKLKQEINEQIRNFFMTNHSISKEIKEKLSTKEISSWILKQKQEECFKQMKLQQLERQNFYHNAVIYQYNIESLQISMQQSEMCCFSNRLTNIDYESLQYQSFAQYNNTNHNLLNSYVKPKPVQSMKDLHFSQDFVAEESKINIQNLLNQNQFTVTRFNKKNDNKI